VAPTTFTLIFWFMEKKIIPQQYLVCVAHRSLEDFP